MQIKQKTNKEPRIIAHVPIACPILDLFTQLIMHKPRQISKSTINPPDKLRKKPYVQLNSNTIGLSLYTSRITSKASLIILVFSERLFNLSSSGQISSIPCAFALFIMIFESLFILILYFLEFKGGI